MLKYWLMLLVVALAFFQSSSASAATIQSYDLDDGIFAIVISGEIVEGDSEKFRREAAKHENAVIILESPGGSTIEAISIGEAIRLRGFGTLVLNETECASACGLIWLAGVPRTLSRTARVGFHATYTDLTGEPLESGVGNALVGRYFTLLNLPTRAIIFATEASPQRLNWLTSENASQTGIEVSLIDDWDWEDGETTPAPVSPPTIRTQEVESLSPTELWSEVGVWSIMVDRSIGDSCFVTAGFDEGTLLRVGIDRLNNGESYLMMANPAWSSLKTGDRHEVTFRLDSNSPWEAKMEVVELDGMAVLSTPFTNNRFWMEFAASNVISIMRGSRVITRLSLDGSGAALDAFLECQKHYNEAYFGKDPFRD